MKNNNISSFEIPAIFSGKKAKFTVTLDHHVLHGSNGKVFDINFYQDLGNKFNNLSPFKDELSHVNGSHVMIHSFDDESFLNIFLLHEGFNQTHNMGYVETPGIALDPAGVNINFEFVN